MSQEVGMSREKRSKGGSPSRTQGARRATEERDGGGALAPGQRWTAGRKREVVLRILRGESLDTLSRELAVEIYRLEQWRDKALSGMDAGLKDRPERAPWGLVVILPYYRWCGKRSLKFLFPIKLSHAA